MRVPLVRLMSFALLGFTAQAQVNKEAPKVPPTRPGASPHLVKGVDFVIRDCRFEKVGKDVRAVATLANRGPEGGSFQTGQTMARLTVRGTQYPWKAPGGGYFLNGGATVEVSHLLKSVPEGSFPATWMANPDRVIAETDFANNEQACDMVVAGPQGALPDLVISSLTVEPTSGAPGTVFSFTITVTNAGDAQAPDTTSQLCSLRMDGAEFKGAIVWSGYMVLAPGKSVVHRARTTTPLVPGTHTFTAKVDSGDTLIEKNEANNTASCTLTVK